MKALSPPPPSLIAFALRAGLMTLDGLVELVRRLSEREAASLAWGLSPSLDDSELVAFLGVLLERKSGVFAAQSELVRRGRFADALPARAMSLELFDEAWPRLHESDRPAWSAAATAEILALIDDSDADTLSLLDGAKVALEATQDWNEHANTAIAFANGFAAEIGEVAKRFDAELTGGDPFIVGYDGWARLFTSERAREVAHSLLG